MTDISLQDYAQKHGRSVAANAMGLTYPRIHQMIARGEPVYLRLKDGEVVGWYIYRQA